ncbi:hypothetical protein DFH11DRAFT_1723554 [Phellopilus nigrolimitatus]|nr:hypothetical protein DFH11DRAFT_1723554 [Phellopilus nigrolimitatus]
MALKSLRDSALAVHLQRSGDRVQELYDITWLRSFETVFEKREIQRSEGNDKVTDSTPVPSHCLVCKAPIGDSDVNGVLVRSEYLKALQDVVALSKNPTMRFAVDDVVDDDDDEDVTASPSATGSGRNGFDSIQADDTSVDQTADVEANVGSGLCPGDLPLDFINPFLTEYSGKKNIKGDRGVVVLGHPGIGQPTIFQNQDENFYILNDEGVFMVDCPSKTDPYVFHEFLPRSTWYLVDSTLDMKGVSKAARALPFFIVQASPPSKERLYWLKKYPKASKYFMKPWTLSELIAGRMLQETFEVLTERQLENFFVKYGPTARFAYASASSPLDYEDELKAEIALLKGLQELKDILHDSVQLNLSHDISHKILLVLPGAFRRQFSITMPSKHVYDLLRQSQFLQVEQVAAVLYNLFVQTPFTRAAAGYILDEEFQIAFRKGGQWSIKPLTLGKAGKKNVTWEKPSSEAPPTWLCFGFGRKVLQVSNTKLPGDPQPITTTYFVHRQNLELKDGLYCPSSRNQATFDAFVYEAQEKRATVFQATVGSSSHAVKEEGLDWLERLGVETFRFVAVTPPGSDVRLPFPRAGKTRPAEEKHNVPEKYLLVFTMGRELQKFKSIGIMAVIAKRVYGPGGIQRR